MDVVILDHHSLPPSLPEAFAILHPQRRNGHPDASPCGAGVAWSFIGALQQELGNPNWDGRETDIALAMIGTIADVMELTGGNRTLVREGLRAFNAIVTGPLALLRTHAGLDSPATSRDIAFRIAPRINAAGRMADPHIALQGLLGDASSLSMLEELNRERQETVKGLLQDYEEHASFADRFVCIVDQRLTPGVCGLVAGKITERFHRPVLVAAEENGVCTASLRSVPGYDVAAMLRRVGHLLNDFGGHAMAAGCSFVTSTFDNLRAACIADAEQYVTDDMLVPRLHFDVEIDHRIITPALCNALEALEPCGQGNPEPRFLVRHASLSDVRTIGSDRTHVQARLGGKQVIGFGHAALAGSLSTPVDLLCRIGCNDWRGQRNVQLRLDDVRIAHHIPAPPSYQAVVT
jgi:single-stranded-DNA-specific exonuclease